MTYRQLFGQIMSYGPLDRMPVIHWTGWPETMARWVREGMPEGVNEHEYFQTVPYWVSLRLYSNRAIWPRFEEKVFEETEEYCIVRDGEGVIQKRWKLQSNIPHHIDATLKTAADWPEYRKRLQPDEGRFQPGLIERLTAWSRKDGLPCAINCGSLMGWIRNWMGVENMCYLMYDRPDVYAEMVDTLSGLSCWHIDQVMKRIDFVPDLGFGWEDICGRSGPFVSPDIFRRCVAPGYRKIRSKLESYGIRLYGVDSDGDVSALAPCWIEAGINVLFPIEPGTWGNSPEKFRKLYGRDLRMVGGFDKLALERGRGAIDAEIERHVPLMKEGGYLMMPDHLITPGVPLDDYRYYLDRIRALRF